MITDMVSITYIRPDIGKIYSIFNTKQEKANNPPKNKLPWSPIKSFAGCILNLKNEIKLP